MSQEELENDKDLRHQLEKTIKNLGKEFYQGLNQIINEIKKFQTVPIRYADIGNYIMYNFHEDYEKFIYKIELREEVRHQINAWCLLKIEERKSNITEEDYIEIKSRLD